MPIFKTFIISNNEMDKSEKQQLKQKTKNVRNSWLDWLINHIPKPTKKLQIVLKITLSLYNLKTNKIVCSSGKKLSRPKIQKTCKTK